MLFNSYQFIFLFLPVVILGYFVLGRLGRLPAVVWLVLASIGFFAFSRVDHLAVLLPSIVLDYLIARGLHRLGESRARVRALPLRRGLPPHIAVPGLCH